MATRFGRSSAEKTLPGVATHAENHLEINSQPEFAGGFTGSFAGRSANADGHITGWRDGGQDNRTDISGCESGRYTSDHQPPAYSIRKI